MRRLASLSLSLSLIGVLGLSGLAAADDGPPPYTVQVRAIEQKTEVLKQEAWELNARLHALKEKLLGERGETRATIVQENQMGGNFRLMRVQYALDGQLLLARNDDRLADQKSFEVWSGVVPPGSHLLSVTMLFRGNGYNIFTYLRGYRFPVHSSASFVADEGRHSQLVVSAHERGDITTPLAKRPGVGYAFRVLDPLAP